MNDKETITEKEEASPEEEAEKAKEKDFRIQAVLGFIGGVILVFTNATGEAGGFLQVIRTLIEQNIIPQTIGNTIILALTLLIIGGGFTVIGGSLLLPTKLRFIGIRIISIGAGVSLISLIFRIIAFAPKIQENFTKAYEDVSNLYEAFSLLGFGIGFLGVGVLLAFLATFYELKWPILIASTSFLAMISGIATHPSQLMVLLGYSGEPSGILQTLFTILKYFGPFLLIVALLYGMGWRLLAKIFLGIGIFLAVHTIVIILIQLFMINGYPRISLIVGFSRITGLIVTIILSAYVIKEG